MIGLIGCAAMLDKQPPRLTLDEAPELAQSVEITLVVEDPETGVAQLTVSTDSGEPVLLEVPTDGLVVWAAPPELPDGRHEFVFEATDGAWTPNVSRVAAVRTLDRTPPTLTLAPSSGHAHQGRTWAVWLKASEPLVNPTLTVLARGDDGKTVERTTPFYPIGPAEDGVWRALRGIELRESLGPHPVKIDAADALGNQAHLETTVEIRATAFEEGGYIKLTKKQTEARKDEEAIAKMRKARNEAYAAVIPEQHWSGIFIEPVAEARMTSPFGKYRTYSDGRKSYHTGLDLSLELGAPVLSAADGQVLVAHEMALFGNVVIVHHGQGVCTSYNHLDTILVQAGDRVKAGQQVGTLGSTGQSTGPHLHWGMEVAEVAVDPGEWLSESFVKVPAFNEPGSPEVPSPQTP
jgi:murein DD-endopeptidase MepM/ murein hydrolase activator NlpD